MRIAVFDYQIIPSNPIGGCHLRMLQGLCHEHEFTVFAVAFANPDPDRIRWVRVPTPTRPLALLYVVYHLLALLYYWFYRLRERARFDLVQMVEFNLGFGDVSYAHFCHRAYLRRHWRASRPGGARRALRWLDHRLHALVEPWIYRRARRIVVASRGLERELADEYPVAQGKSCVIPNPVDVGRMRAPASFDRAAFREELGIGPDDVALVFVALGQFERKGLPLLLAAMDRLRHPRLRLIVVGGTDDLVREYKARVGRMDLDRRVSFVGMQRDVRPYLWAADAFVFPSFYEVFPLVTLEAAAAGLPLIATPLYGVEEFLQDGENGILIERSINGVAQGLERLLSLPAGERQAMGERAERSVSRYTTERFVGAWRTFYAEEARGHMA